MPTWKFDGDSDLLEAHWTLVRSGLVAIVHLVVHPNHADSILRKQLGLTIA
jgi:hypothetical protein